MPAPTPTNLLEAIASGASSGFITNPIPNSPTGSNAASISGGFPPTTMTNEQAGGKPPLGQDINGFLFLISSHTLYVQCGQLYLYDAAVSTAIGGYAKGTILGMTDGTGIWMSIVNANTSNPDAGGAGWIAIASYGIVAVPVTTGVAILTPAQYRRNIIQFTGTLTGNVTVMLPNNIVGEWVLVNSTSGAFTLTATAGGSGVVIPQGGFATPTGVYVVGDGNAYPLVAPLSVAIDQNPNPLTIVERNNAGEVLATHFYGTSAYENPTIGGVTVVNNSDNNFFRKITLTNFEAQLLLQAMSGQLINSQVPFSVVSQWASALFANAALTGVPTAPTPPAGTSTSQIATAGFVNPGSSLTGAGPWYRINPDGSIDQWGSTIVNIHVGAQAIAFGIPFPTVCHEINISIEASVVGWDYWIVSGSKATTGFQFNNNASSGGTVIVNWRSIGR